MKTLSILAFAILSLASAQDAPVAEPDTVPTSDDPVWDDEEMEKWIFSDGEDKTPDQIQNEEIMWEIDLDVQKARGFMQGWFRGFYKDFDWEIQPACFSKESVKYVYYF